MPLYGPQWYTRNLNDDNDLRAYFAMKTTAFAETPLRAKTECALGARESVAAHGLYRPTRERPATFTRTLSRECNGGHALNWQPGAAALLQGPQKTSNAKRLLQRLARDKGARQMEWSRSRRTLDLQGLGAKASVGCLGLPYRLFILA